MSERARLLCVFAAALTVRWGVALMLFASMGNDGLLGTDSRGFLQWMTDYAAVLHAGGLSGWSWLGPSASLMPLPSWLWIGNALLFGEYSALTSILCQGVLDSGTCVLIYGMARSFDPRYALPAGIAAALNPTQVVMSSLYYTDTMFLFFVSLVLYGAVRWLFEPAWRPAVLLGVGLGGAMLSRVLIAPWAVFLLLYLTGFIVFQHKLRRTHLNQLSVAILIAAICTAPIVVRNRVEAGTWTLTTQTGAHAAFWVVPLVMQANDGTPWERGAEQIKGRVEAKFGPDTDNLGENSRRHSQVATEALRELGMAAIAKAWFYGAAINLGAPAATIFPPLAQLPRTGFYGTPGTSMPEKIGNFLFHSDNNLYAWSLLMGIVGLTVFRLIQARGAIALVRQRRLLPATLLLASWVVFVLLVNGPIASPKYRLPIEPVLMILTAAGYCALRERSRSQSMESICRPAIACESAAISQTLRDSVSKGDSGPMAGASKAHDGREHLPALTGVRALAALLVLFLHANQNFPNALSNNILVNRGYLGVDLFFVLSGFIIAHVYLDALVPLRLKPLCVFLWHRFIRLFPAHFAVLLALVVLIVLARWAGITLNEPRGWDYRDLPWHFLMAHSWGTVNYAGWNAPSWSISAEWFAYLLFPGVAAATLALPRRTALPLAVAALLIGAVLFHVGDWHVKTAWIGLPALIRVSTEFICGVLLYRAVKIDTLALSSRLSDGLAFGGLLGFCAAAAVAASDAMLIAMLAVLIAGVSGQGKGVRAVFGCRPVIWLGEISYSIYVVHFPLLLVLNHGSNRVLGHQPPALPMFAISVALVIGAASLLYYLIEYPARRRLRNVFGTIDAAPTSGVPAHDSTRQ